MIACFLTTALAALAGTDGAARAVPFTFGTDVRGSAIVRGDAGRSLVLTAAEDGLSLTPLLGGDRVLAVPRGEDRTVAYCVAGSGERQRVFILDERRRIRALDTRSGTVEVLSNQAESLLPSGVYRLEFATDLDGDGDVDFALPVQTGFQLWLRDGEQLRKGPRVAHRIAIDVDARGYRSRNPGIHQSIRVPRFAIEDQNGDGRPDLSFRDREIAQFFWSDAKGEIPAEPTFVIDLEKLKSQLPKAKRGLIDPKNLLAVLDGKVSHVSRDLDGDGVFDLLMQKGKNVLVYRGTKDGVDLKKAVAALPTSGNLLAVAAYDENGDSKLDLFMLHVGDVSLAQLLLWLVAGGELRLDLFVYAQEDGLKFARKPTSHRTLVLDLPAAKSTVDDIEVEIKKLRERLVRVPVLGDFDGDGERDDLAALVDGKRIDVFADAAHQIDFEEVLSWAEVAKRFDRDAKGKSELTVSIAEIVPWLPLLPIELDQRVRSATPSHSIDLLPLGITEAGGSTLWALDLDFDGREEFAVLVSGAETDPPQVLFVFPRG